MEKEIKTDPVDQPIKASGDDGKKVEDSVGYKSYQKALDEKKRAQETNSSLETELKSLREADLKRRGKTDELLANKDAEIARLSGQLSEQGKNYTWSSLTKEIKNEAVKNGCKNPDKLIKLMSKEDLQELSKNIGDDFTINGDALKNVIEKNKEENFFLFESSKKTIVNGNPTKKIVEKEETNLSELTLDELKALHKKSYK